MKKLLLFLIILITSGMETNIAMTVGNTDKISNEKRNVKEIYPHITTNDSVRHIVNHPAFEGFGYSLWGSSAGARMVGDIAENGTASLGGYDLNKPRIVVIAYTGHTSFSENYPPVFITVSEDDGIVNVSVVDRRVGNLRNAGIEVEYRKYKNAGHGFGLGVGTDAEGWIEHAIRFWENHLSK